MRQSPSSWTRAARAVTCVSTTPDTIRNTPTASALLPISENDSSTTIAIDTSSAPSVAGPM